VSASLLRGATLALLGSGVAASLLLGESANQALGALKAAVVSSFDWLFIGVATGTLLFVIGLALHPRSNVRLGADDSEPEFSRFSWFSMLFSAGLASGLLYWAAAEPVLHFQDNPFRGEAASAAARASALRITIFHWGLHGWGMYVLGGLAIGLYSYRFGRALTIRSALYPVFGDQWIDRWPGYGVDFLALLGTIFGVATSLGLAAAAMNATLHSLLGLEMSVASQVGIVAAVSAFGVVSALSGVARGVRRLSEVNVAISAVFIATIFVLASSGDLLFLGFTSAADYFWNVIPLGLWRGETEAQRAWQGDWTVFYWGWWMAWMPFVSLFIARISKGRSVREFVAAVLAVPTLVIIIWMTVLGGTALEQELGVPGSVSAAVGVDYSHGIVQVIDNLASPRIAFGLTACAAFLLFTWLITSLDSATLVITQLVDRAEDGPQKALWGGVLAAVTAALIYTGGVGALQAASIVIGLPLAFVMLLIGAGLSKDVLQDRLRTTRDELPANSPREDS